MRVITGSVRGRKLKEPKGLDIRPTSDMIKEAVFNIIQYDIEGRRVLDLFAGTGQMGVEALSRGAAEVVFADESRESVKLVRENLALCGFEARVEQTDSIGYIDRCGRFDLILLDPPYDSGLLESALKRIRNVDILSDGGIIICESPREKSMPELAEPYVKTLERNYGKIKITVYIKETNK
ncbi:MAG: 16S rRNA (guanine(966)-N(2))-methyltransferase RsmD [Oscillospiraceae bacterium]